MPEARPVAVQDGEVDKPALVPELVLAILVHVGIHHRHPVDAEEEG